MFWNKKLKLRIQQLEEELKEYPEKISNLQTDVNKLIFEKYQLNNEIAELKGKLRQETEADLFFSCAKIQKGLIEGKSKTDLNDEIVYRNSLQLQVQRMNIQQQASPLQQLIGGFR